MNINAAKQFELDFSNCSTLGEIYDVIKNELELPEWFGGNMSAFWDALTGIIEVPAVIIFHKQVRNKDLLPFVEKLIEIAHRAECEEYLELAVIEKE